MFYTTVHEINTFVFVSPLYAGIFLFTLILFTLIKSMIGKYRVVSGKSDTILPP